MALSLDDINKPKHTKSKKNKTKEHNRPWESTAVKTKSEPETVHDEDNTDYLSFISAEEYPELNRILNTALNKLQKKSYWLSRFTFKNSWMGRIETQPKIKIPLPSFFTRKT